MTQYDEQINRVDVLSCMNSLFALGDTECAIEINTARARWCSVGSMELLASPPEDKVGYFCASALVETGWKGWVM